MILENQCDEVFELLKEWIKCTDEAHKCPSMLLSSRHSDEATNKAADIMKRLTQCENDLRTITETYFRKE
ncbi:MAG: hypothetical protein KAS32_05470 [Candidatus Peribacteraceae bacterium]|nr:hypothetical protein [Candidatus Peribacteraceae bacterium]